MDLLNSIHRPTESDPESGSLLNEIGEGGGTPWQPHKDPDHPKGLEGDVLSRSKMTTDPKFGAVREVERVELRTDDGRVWSITGFHRVLNEQITKVDPQRGDRFAVRYFGVVTSRTGNDYYGYGAAKRSRQ